MWQCVTCGQEVEEDFEGCWNCGTTRDGVEYPFFRKADEDEAEASDEQSTDTASTREKARKKRNILYAFILFVLVCGVVVALWIWEAGRCEVILKKNGVPLAGATVQVVLSSQPQWEGVYTLDSEGRWDMGWHLFDRPENLIVIITDNSEGYWSFTFPKENGWVVDFCGNTVTRTRRVSWGIFHITQNSSVTDLTPKNKKPTED